MRLRVRGNRPNKASWAISSTSGHPSKYIIWYNWYYWPVNSYAPASSAVCCTGREGDFNQTPILFHIHLHQTITDISLAYAMDAAEGAKRLKPGILPMKIWGVGGGPQGPETGDWGLETGDWRPETVEARRCEEKRKASH